MPVYIRFEHIPVFRVRGVELGPRDPIFEERVALQISDAVGRERVVHQHVRVVSGGVPRVVGPSEGDGERRQRPDVTRDEVGEDGIVHVGAPPPPHVEVMLTDLLVFGFRIHRLVLARPIVVGGEVVVGVEVVVRVVTRSVVCSGVRTVVTVVDASCVALVAIASVMASHV